MSRDEILIRPAETPGDLDAVKALFLDYASSLHFDLGFQGFQDEMAGFPGDYSPPKGALLLARVNRAPAGAVGLRPLAPGVCEIKRMYVRPDYRGFGLGRRLADAIIETGRAIGYDAMRMDTVTALKAANALYESLGFRDIPPYCFNPQPDVRYLEKRPL